jgi:hypothetical protein
MRHFEEIYNILSHKVLKLRKRQHGNVKDLYARDTA